MSVTPVRRFVLGTAGHIDHGKTALVRALTGVDTDRLKEERERGITIDLGFAHLDLGEGLHIGLVDVPGHEGFIRNMVAGATGIDAVLLVVAADEGVMPQTREHLDIVELLGVRRGVVALTKADLVDREWLELVTEDVREALAGRALAGMSLVPTSVRTSEGISALKQTLAELFAGSTPGRTGDADVFRLPVDRAFTVKGTGTVVTGTVWSGQVRVGQHVYARPGGFRARVRTVQVHGTTRELAAAGERAALGLVGVEREAVPRGVQLCGLEAWEATTRVTSRVRLLSGSRVDLERGRRVRVHLATAEVMARCYPLEGDTLPAGTSGWIELRLERPVLTRTGDRFVLRSYSPMATIGGGEIGEPFPPRRRRRRAPIDLLEQLLSGEPADSVAATLELAGSEGIPVALVPVVAGLQVVGAGPSVGVTASDRLYSEQNARTIASALVDDVRAFHAARGLEPGMPIEQLRRGSFGAPPLVDSVLLDLIEKGGLRREAGTVSLPDFEPRLDDDARRHATALLETFRGAGLAPPRVSDLPGSSGIGGDVWSLVRFLEREGELLHLEDDLFVWSGHFTDAVERVRTSLGGKRDLGPADFREALAVSRRYLLPLLHRLDQEGVTVRDGTLRSVPD